MRMLKYMAIATVVLIMLLIFSALVGCEVIDMSRSESSNTETYQSDGNGTTVVDSDGNVIQSYTNAAGTNANTGSAQ